MNYSDLTAAMRERAPGALERFQTAFTPLMKYIIAPILPDERDREECLADVILQAWESIGSYDPEKASLTTWLTILTRNAALNRRRAIARRREDGQLDVQALWDAVGRLDEWDRAMFLRKYYYYQSTAQIAAELGLTLRAVEGRLYRIRKRLQKELGGVYRG